MALLCAGAITVFVSRRVRVNSGPPKVTQIVAADRDLSPGMTLSGKDLTTIDWPTELPLSGSFSKTDLVVGRPLIYSLASRQPVLERDLGIAGSGLGLASRIPPGMRATAVRSNEVVGVAGFLFPGSHVDVLATYNSPGSQTSVTQTVLQDVEVLTTGSASEADPQGKPLTVSVVTLLVTPEDSQKLLLASAQGTIQFVLRNGTDQQRVEIHSTRLDQLDQSGSATPPPQRASRPAASLPLSIVPEKPKPPEAPKPEPYSMEVIQGTQRGIQKF